MLLWNRINPISQHTVLTYMHINQLQQILQQAFTIHYKSISINHEVPFRAEMLLIHFTVNGSHIIPLHSVFVQGIWALHTLPMYIYYELLTVVYQYLYHGVWADQRLLPELKIICYPVIYWLWHSYAVNSLVMCEAIKETQTRHHILQQSILYL